MNHFIKKVKFISILPLIIILGNFLFLPVQKIHADGWLTGFSYRKEIMIAGQSGAGTDYQVKLFVGETSGAEGEDFDLEGHATDFPNDIKFTDNDGFTELSYWVESITGTAPDQLATVWIKISDNLDSNQSIYVYYGNEGQANSGSGDDTFILFDDFEGQVVGDTPDGWTIENPTGGTVEISNVAKYGSQGMMLDDTNSGSPTIATFRTMPPQTGNIMVQFYLRNADMFEAYGYQQIKDSEDDYYIRLRNYRTDYRYYTGTIYSDLTSMSVDIWYKIELAFNGGTKITQIYIDDLLKAENATENDTTPIDVAEIRFTGHGTLHTPTYYYDNVIVRKYIDSEPGYSEVGSERESSSVINSPTFLGPPEYIDGSWRADIAPALRFTQSDEDEGGTVKYRVQIDDSADFGSPVVDYTSAPIEQGAAEFNVGQAAVDGTYVAGGDGQTLSGGSYYWRVMSTYDGDLESSWSTANSGEIAFKIDVEPPGNIGIDSVVADSSAQMTVTASTATDDGAGLHATPYWFTEVSGNSGGASSTEWQASAIFINDGLSPNTQYTYKVKSRDALENESDYSTVLSSYTLANVPASLAATAGSQTRIILNWEANSNSIGTEYYIENKTDGNNSGWITDTEYEFSGLTCGTEYTFRAKAKNAENIITDWTDDVRANTNVCNQNAASISGQYIPGLFGYDYQKQTQNRDQASLQSQSFEPAERFVVDINRISQPIWKPVTETMQDVKEALFPENHVVEYEPPERESPVPPVFQNIWNILPSGATDFALSPLPREFLDLKKSFSNISNLFDQTGVVKASDLPKMVGIQLVLPGLGQLVGDRATIIPSGFAVSDLSESIKEKIPSGQVFVQSLGNLDANVKIKLDSLGKIERFVHAVVRCPVHLTIKVEKPVQRVYGYLIAKNIAIPQVQNQNILSLSRAFLASLVADKKESSKELLLQEFDYADHDGDGIYEADIVAPAIKGSYHVKTVIEYQDAVEKERETNMVLVVDPEGYVYKTVMGEEVRVKNAQVSLYWLNLQTSEYNIWPAKDFSQQNPQTTDVTGQYAFLVPPGTYYLQIDASGYRQYKSQPFQVLENQNIHENIEMIPIKSAWWNFDWKFWVLAILLAAILTALLIALFRKAGQNRRINNN